MTHTKGHMLLSGINVVGASGLEPPTPTMSRWCSNQLSYAPIIESRSIAGLGGVAKGGLQAPDLSGPLVLQGTPTTDMSAVDWADMLRRPECTVAVTVASVPILCPKCAQEVHAGRRTPNGQKAAGEHHLNR